MIGTSVSSFSTDESASKKAMALFDFGEVAR
jgi:hypothetical protein